MKKLERFTALYAAVFDIEYNDLRGFSETNKTAVSYMAFNILDYSLEEISNFYRMGEKRMTNQWEDIEKSLEETPYMGLKYEQLKILWLQLTDPQLELCVLG